MSTLVPYVPKRDADRFAMYIFDISYFSGKLEAYFKYREIPFDRIEVTWWELASKIAQETGLMEVPVVHDKKENIWLSDSSPIIEYFEKYLEDLNTVTPLGVQLSLPHYKALDILPKDPVQLFFSHLLGDFADEWLWKPAIYYRWSHTTDIKHYSRRFVDDFYHNPILPKWLARKIVANRMKLGYVKKDGIRCHDTQRHTERLYLETLQILNEHFQKYPYLLGDSPTFVDFCFFGSYFRHFSLDPTPAKIMRQQGTAVYEWVARLWNAKQSVLPLGRDAVSLAEPGSIPETWIRLLPFVKEHLVYLRHNADADKAGKKHFDFSLDNVHYNHVEVVPYRSWRRELLHRRYNDLGENDQKIVRAILEENGLWEDFIATPWISNYYKDTPEPPFTRGEPAHRSFLHKVRMFASGTPRHTNDWIFTPLMKFVVASSIAVATGLVVAALYYR